MPNKLYKFTFSPPARLAWLSSKIYDVPTEIIEVDLSKAEQFNPDFLKANPKHMVPVFDHGGKYVTESRIIAKYFHENFNNDKEKYDHWYPSDPEQRAKVDEWLDWSDERHLDIGKPALMHIATVNGSPWRENYGILITIVGNKMKRNHESNRIMKKCLADAEIKLSERTIVNTEDLNLGDLAVFFETSVAFFCHPDIHYRDYPNQHNLYKVLQKLPEFVEIDDAFCEFVKKLINLSENGASSSIFTYFKETWATMKFLGTLITVSLRSKL